MKEAERKKIIQAVADYMGSEGCSCCQLIDEHRSHKNTLGKILGLKRTKDWYGKGEHGYDFSKYRTTEKKSGGGE